MLPCLILAAGIGSRLDPLTRIVAKAAVPLAGRSLIERVIDGLRDQGVSDVVINLHHKPETITALVGDGSHLGIRARYSWEPQVLGSAGGPRQALDLLGAPVFVIVNGDTLTDVRIEPLVNAHRRTGAAVTLAVVPNPDPAHYNGLDVDEGGWVTGGRRKGSADGSWHFIGVQVVNAAVFASLDAGQPAETIQGVYRDLMAAGPGRIRAIPVDTPFLDVGTPRDYLDAALTLAHAEGRAVAIDAEPGSVAPTARLTRVVVWPGVTIGPDVRLSDCVVATGVQIPPGLSFESAVLLPADVARRDERVDIRHGIAAFPLGRSRSPAEA